LVVRHGHSDERVDPLWSLEEGVEVAQLLDEPGAAGGRRVGHRAREGVADNDPLVRRTESDRLVAKDGADLTDELHGDGPGGELFVPTPQGRTVTEYFLGLRISGAGLVQCSAEELILRGDNVLDLRAELGFLEGDGVDED